MIAEASLIGGIFGKGGGNELDSALTLQALVEALRAARRGRRAWLGLPLEERPRGADDGLGKRFPYETAHAVRQARPGAARPRLGAPTPVAPPAPPRRARATGAADAVGAPLQRAARQQPGHASNWELVSRHASRPPATRSACSGPQVGYYVPQILMEEDLHGPGHRRARRGVPRRQPAASSSATAATTPGARRRRPPTTSTPSPRSSARTTSTTATRASAGAMEKLERTNSLDAERGRPRRRPARRR